MISHQSFDEWLKNPIQGAKPLPPNIEQAISERCPCYAKPLNKCDCETALNPELIEVAESLATAVSWLENAYCLIGSNGLNKRYKRLYTSICDAMHSAREAMERLEDQPDEE